MYWMKILSIVSLSAIAGAVAAKIDSRHKFSGLLCSDVPCAHFNTRMLAIESVIAQQSGGLTYLAIGDSITEFADLEPICGRKPVNAGIGGATSETFATHGARLAALLKPDFIVVALGTNDAIRDKPDFREHMATLLFSLKGYRVVVVRLPAAPRVTRAAKYNAVLEQFEPLTQPIKSIKYIDDGIHLAPSAYPVWKASISDAVVRLICPS
jgi:lysophospholipase L1-like esterase